MTSPSACVSSHVTTSAIDAPTRAAANSIGASSLRGGRVPEVGVGECALAGRGALGEPGGGSACDGPVAAARQRRPVRAVEPVSPAGSKSWTRPERASGVDRVAKQVGLDAGREHRPSPLEDRGDREAGRLAGLRRCDDERRLARLGGEQVATAPAERDAAGGRVPHAQRPQLACRAPTPLPSGIAGPTVNARPTRSAIATRATATAVTTTAANQKPNAPGSDVRAPRWRTRSRDRRGAAGVASPRAKASPRPSCWRSRRRTRARRAPPVDHVQSGDREHSQAKAARWRSRTGESPTASDVAHVRPPAACVSSMRRRCRRSAPRCSRAGAAPGSCASRPSRARRRRRDRGAARPRPIDRPSTSRVRATLSGTWR